MAISYTISEDVAVIGQPYQKKRVWESGKWDEQQQRPIGEWEYEVSKVELAKALWPTLVHKIQARMVSAAAPVPPIAEVVQGAYHTAQRWRTNHMCSA